MHTLSVEEIEQVSGGIIPVVIWVVGGIAGACGAGLAIYEAGKAVGEALQTLSH